MPSSGGEENTEQARKKNSWFPLAVRALAQSLLSSSRGPVYLFLCLLTPLPRPQGLAPVVVLRLAVGFMQALAGTSRMPSWRGDLVRPCVWGSMGMCGWRCGAVAVGQAALGGRLHLALYRPSQGGGGRGRVADSPR